jgi:putative membrane protein
MWPWMLIGSLVVIAALIALGFLIVRLARGDDRRTHPNEIHGTARLILDERYARGEIDQDEYRKRRETLQ